MDGFTVMKGVEAARTGEVFISVTGGIHAIGREADAGDAQRGHPGQQRPFQRGKSTSRPFRRWPSLTGRCGPSWREYVMGDGRKIYLLADGRLINLAAAEGHPSAVMDMSFANQALSVEYIVKNRGQLAAGVHSVPRDTDQEVGRLKLESLGINIDSLSNEQQKYQESWQEGT